MFAKSFEILGRIEFFLGQNTISNVKAARICYSGNLSVPIHWVWLIKCISATFSLQNTEDPILWRQLPCMTTGWTVPFQGTFQDKKQLLVHVCTQFFGQHPRKLCKLSPNSVRGQEKSCCFEQPALRLPKLSTGHGSSQFSSTTKADAQHHSMAPHTDKGNQPITGL